jgi:hypothetical protein
MNPGFPRFFLLFVLFVLVLCGGSQAYRLYDGRAEARRILRDTVAELRRRLPPPDKADAAAMPQKLPRLREGVYYAERKAYKYTFDEHNPEFLERRSIWLSPQGGRWRCWAGVKNSIAPADCGEREIVAGLTEREHARLAKRSRMWCSCRRKGRAAWNGMSKRTSKCARCISRRRIWCCTPPIGTPCGSSNCPTARKA